MDWMMGWQLHEPEGQDRQKGLQSGVRFGDAQCGGEEKSGLVTGVCQVQLRIY